MFENVKGDTVISTLPESICFHSALSLCEYCSMEEAHPWGEFIYAIDGTVDILTESDNYVACFDYGIWIPPGIAHHSIAYGQTRYGSLLISATEGMSLPMAVYPLRLFPLGRALVECLLRNRPICPYTDTERKILRLLVDQIAYTAKAQHPLTYSDDPFLLPVLHYIEANLGKTVTLIELAELVNTTPRTLIRRSQRHLGMSLTEWRQRLCIMKALVWLEEGESIETIAYELGYSSASAFIVMFRKVMDITPAEFRNRKDNSSD